MCICHELKQVYKMEASILTSGGVFSFDPLLLTQWETSWASTWAPPATVCETLPIDDLTFL